MYHYHRRTLHDSLLALLVLCLCVGFTACDKEDNGTDAPAEDACRDFDRADETLNCRVGTSYWRVASVTSDRPRADASQPDVEPTTDWMEYRKDCYADHELLILAWASVADEDPGTGKVVWSDTTYADWNILPGEEGNSTGCETFTVPIIVETHDLLTTAAVDYTEGAGDLLYGYSGEVTGERWRDIQYDAKAIAWTTDKRIDDQVYEVRVVLERSRPE